MGKHKKKTAATKAKKSAATALTKIQKKSVAKCKSTLAIKILAGKYADAINSSRNWKWRLDVGPSLSASDKLKIRAYAKNKGLVPTIPVDSNQYADFSGHVADDNTRLPKTLWNSRDSTQFNWLNKDLKSRNPSYDPDTQTFPPDTKKYTWHHHQDKGRMQLVEFGVHNATNHKGGRTTWATGPR